MINQNWIYLGTALNLLGASTYIRDVLRGKARPNLASWAVLSISPMIAFASMIYQHVGFRQSLMTFMVGFTPLLITISGLMSKHPKWKIVKGDIFCVSLAVVGIILWLSTDQPNLAIVFSILADSLGFMPTLIKSFHHPDTESPYLFLLGSINSFIALAIITKWDFQHLAFPVYITIADIVALLLIHFQLGPKIKSHLKTL